MYSIGKLCKEFNLSRSALLYYDSIGLLVPSERTDGNYRAYSEIDKKRLEQICAYREAGVTLVQIKGLLDNGEASERNILERRLEGLNQEIRYLRFQQKLIVEMLKGKNGLDKKVLLDVQVFTSILKSAGLDEKTMNQFHMQMEQESPDSHQFFLEILGLSDDEIRRVREQSQEK